MKKLLLCLLIIATLSLQTLKAQDTAFQRLVEWDTIEEALHQEVVKFIHDRQNDSSLTQRYVKHPETGLICEILGDEQLCIAAVFLYHHDWLDYIISHAQQDTIKRGAERKFTSLYGEPKILTSNNMTDQSWMQCSSWYVAASITQLYNKGVCIILTVKDKPNL